MAVDHFVLLRQITQAAMPPKTARSTRETMVMISEVPKADQKLKLELLITLVRLVFS